MSFESDSIHTYFTRSKGSITEQEKKFKSYNSVKSCGGFKIVDLNEEKKKEKKKFKFNLEDIMPLSFIDKLIESIDNSDSDIDDDYEPIEGIPDDVELSYEEEEYLKNLSSSERKLFVDSECQLSSYRKQEIPARFKVMKLPISVSLKSKIIHKIETLENLEPSDNEYSKLNQWLTSFDNIPFGTYNDISIEKKPKAIINLFKTIKQNLDNSVFGHDDAKNHIIQLIGQQISNPQSKGGGCMAIQGPPGNGKTTLIKKGICNSLNRPFGFVPLGGMHSSDFLVGHDYTYEGSKCGRIIEILQQSNCMNPIIYFDELDKVSESSKGSEIENLLCHITDSSQNHSFHDKYFSGLDIDLSNVLFVFAYNDESKINPILLDRMTKINTDGFNSESKINITKNYLLPNICKEINFDIKNIIINDYTIKNIIENHTNSEKGVRNLKRCIEKIVSKLNIMNLIYEDNNVEGDSDDIDNCVESVLNEIIDSVLSNYSKSNKSKQSYNNILDMNLEKFKLPYEINVDNVSQFLIGTKQTNMSTHMMYM